MVKKMNNIFNIEELSAWYQKGTCILQGLSISIEKNEIVGLLGVNGSGKTTLINTISGLHLSYNAKKVSFQMSPISFTTPAFKLSRYTVFSDDESFKNYTFDEYMHHVFSSYRKHIDINHINRLVEGFGFSSNRKKLIKELSYGNKRKAYLITAFSLRPDLLFLDEPMNGLDFQSVEYLYHEMNQYRSYGAILFSSHILESFAQTSDKVYILENGKTEKILQKEQLGLSKMRGELNEQYFSHDDKISSGKRGTFDH